MSTEFRNVTTDEWVGIRYCKKGPFGPTSFDWGTNEDNANKWIQAIIFTDESFVDESGSVCPPDEFLTMVLGCNWTFGVFGGTMKVGSGDIVTFQRL
jgi:hypothetical protein